MNELLLFSVNQAQGAAPPGGALGGLLPLLLMFVIFYFLLIRPQKKRQQAHAQMISRLKKGDEVVTAGGVIGSIFALTDSELVLEVADKVKVRVMRNQVQMYKAAETSTEKEE
ncbi:MAG: preprotein translocase subunit YajC [Bradymonadia bacterium]